MTALSQLIDSSRSARSISGMSDWAQALVNTITSGYSDTDRFRQKTSFAPSGLFYGSGDCPRRWVLSFRGCLHESKTTPQNIMRMKKGIADHARIQEAMLSAGIVLDIEKEIIHEDPPIHAFVDAIVDFENEVVTVEVKTTSMKNFEYRQKTNQVTAYHLGQLLMYMYLLDIKKGVIIYEATKADGEVMLHAIPVNMTDEYEEQIERVLDWCRKIWKVYQDGRMPARGHREGSKICQGCPVEKACAENTEPTIKVQRLRIDL